MNRIITALILLGLTGSVTAGTVAQWNFEEGVDGVANSGVWDNHYLDISGNGNHMSSWVEAENPTATSDNSGGAGNTLALDFDNFDNIGTFASSGGLNSTAFNSGWTIEASFKLDVLGTWQVVVAKQGLGTANGETLEAPFWMKTRAFDDRLEILFFDDSASMRVLSSIDPLQNGKWYHAAATYDNTEAKFYLKGETDTDYVLQSSLTFGDGAALDRNNEYWTVGRGTWDGGPADAIDGRIDNVRISDIALASSEFIAVPEPSTLGMFALVGGGILWFRRIRSRYTN